MGRTIYSDGYRTLLGLVRQLREATGLSQAGLGARLERPQSWVSKVETGERRLDIAELPGQPASLPGRRQGATAA